ncbi:uncharacterized protein METZ01_LOCUS126211, partial [marine metagenome]
KPFLFGVLTCDDKVSLAMSPTISFGIGLLMIFPTGSVEPKGLTYKKP